MREILRNRIEAGKLLAVAFAVAKALRVPLDVFVVRKLGTPGRSELAMGAITTGGVRVLNEEVVEGLVSRWR